MLPNDILQQAVPGNLRRADQFVRFLRRLVAHLLKRMSVEVVTQESPQAFLLRLLNEVRLLTLDPSPNPNPNPNPNPDPDPHPCPHPNPNRNEEEIDPKTLKFVSDRLRSLLRTLEVTDVQDFTPIMLIADFASLVATYTTGFNTPLASPRSPLHPLASPSNALHPLTSPHIPPHAPTRPNRYTTGFNILIEPFDERTPTLHDPLFQFCCNDASIAMKALTTILRDTY